MELGADNIAALYAADKFVAIIRRGQDDGLVIWNHMVGMDKIKFFIAANLIEDRGCLFDMDAIPSNMGHGQVDLKTLNLAGERTQARHAQCLLAGFKQGMHAQADTEKWAVGIRGKPSMARQTFCVQDPHHVAECPHSWEHQLLSFSDILWGGHDLDGFAQTFDGIDYAADVSGTIVKEGDHCLVPSCSIVG